MTTKVYSLHLANARLRSGTAFAESAPPADPTKKEDKGMAYAIMRCEKISAKGNLASSIHTLTENERHLTRIWIGHQRTKFWFGTIRSRPIMK